MFLVGDYFWSNTGRSRTPSPFFTGLTGQTSTVHREKNSRQKWWKAYKETKRTNKAKLCDGNPKYGTAFISDKYFRSMASPEVKVFCFFISLPSTDKDESDSLFSENIIYCQASYCGNHVTSQSSYVKKETWFARAQYLNCELRSWNLCRLPMVDGICC